MLLIAPKIPAQHGPANDAELNIKKFQVAPGLVVELFASEPLLKNPVAFSIDERGRFFISETHRYKDSIFDITRNTNWLLSDLSFRTVENRAAFLEKEFATNIDSLTKNSELIRLVEDRDGDGRADASSIFAEGFNETTSGTAAGILARKGEVWFTSIPDLWRFTMDDLRFTNQTTRAADAEPRKSQIVNRKSLATGFGVHIGVSGHDLHGLVMGPDGKIYFSMGDRGFSVRTKEGKFLNHPDTGGVLRCNPDGSNLEVFAIGLRNPQELAFDQYGNLFTADNDTAGEDNSRLIHVVEGGDYGWRASYQFMSGYGPWVQEKVWQGGIDGTLPHSGDAAQGPSGLAFYPGTGLPEKYQNHFLVCDFPKGVWSFAVKPKGASYEIFNKEKFLWNLGATDVDFGPDGFAYVSDWGTSYNMPDKGRIYRVFDPESRRRRGDETHSRSLLGKNQSLVTSSPTDIKNLLAEGMEKHSVKELVQLLGHADMRVRMEAQFQLASKGYVAIKPLQKLLEKSGDQLSRIHAVTALGSMGGKPAIPSATTVLLSFLEDKDPEIRAQVAKALARYLTGSGSDVLIKLLNDPNPRVRFFAAQSLGKIKNTNAILPLLEMVRENADQDAYLVHAGVLALVNIGDFDAIQSAAKNENVSIRRAALLAMRRMERPEIAQFLNDPEPDLGREATRAINDMPITAAQPQLAALLNSKTPLANLHSTAQIQILRRAINANFRLGQKSNAVELATFAAKPGAPISMRIEALYALSDWEKPHPLDRVMGLWRPMPTRDKEVARDAIRPQLKEMFSQSHLPAALVDCIRKLGLKEASDDLFKILKDPDQLPEVRSQILQTLVELKFDLLSNAVELALTDPNRDLRREGIKSIALLAPEKTPLLLERLLASETDFRISQTAFATLGKLTNAAATEVLNRQLDLLLAGKIKPELHLDLLDAAEKHSDWRLAGKIVGFKAKFPKDDSLADFRVALVGGNSELGKRIFHEREDVACLRCHAIKGKGGNVGPDLGGIAKTQSREYLLESTIFPNKHIAAGFENILVTTKSGGVYAGLVKSEDATELVLNSPEDGIVKIKKADIEKRDHGLSSMPEGIGNVLTKADLRDLLEFLAGLK